MAKRKAFQRNEKLDWLALAIVTWLLVLVALAGTLGKIGDVQPRQGFSSEMVEEVKSAAHSSQGYEDDLDEMSKRIFHTERTRLDRDRSQRMEAERWKAKINGTVHKLKVARELEPEEIVHFNVQHANELKRLSRDLSKLKCEDHEACKAALRSLVAS
eukprot:gene24174-29347_t